MDARFVVIGSKPQPIPAVAAALAAGGERWRYVRSSPAARRGWALDQLPYARLLRRERVSLFHSPYLFVPVLAPCPTVVTVHDLIWELFPEYSGDGSSGAWQLHRWAARRKAARLIAVSEATAADVARCWGVGADRVSVVPDGTAFGAAAFSNAPEPPAPSLRELLAPGPVIATPFNLQPHKNLAVLLEAFVALQERHPGLRLALFGRAGWKEEAEAAFERRLAAFPFRHLVIRTGLLDDGELAWLYRRAEVCVFPSLYEGFGLPTLEAMAVGACVVGHDASATKEVVGDAGVLVETRRPAALAGAIAGLVADPARREALGTRARERARLFTIERMAEATWQVYRDVLALPS